MSIFNCNITSNTNTMENTDKENKYMRARERVDELKKFYGNLTSYVLVISGLALINYFTTGFGYMWFLWAAFGWGIGIVFHAIKTFDLNPFFGKQWEKRKIEKIMRDEEQNNKWK
ncbi:histidine kinase [Muricauda sp. TY007]|nr:2TM domain-containing protein [Allomuricauda sp.]NDV15961.1 histidine kinase [Muricauda sp. TY007]